MSTRPSHTADRRTKRSVRWRFATLFAVALMAVGACSAESGASAPAESTTTIQSTTSTTEPTTTTMIVETSTTQVEAPEFAHLSAEQPPETIAIEDAGQVPFYARIEPEPGRMMHDGEWAMVYLYRPAECIPPDFDLLAFFHLPSEDDPGAFACGPPTTDGVGYWENGPETDFAPISTVHDGLGSVPVWFVDTVQYREAMEDGLTISELESLDLRKGTASEFHEVLYPDPGYGLSVSASGELEDGTRFEARHRYAEGKQEVTNIEFSE